MSKIGVKPNSIVATTTITDAINSYSSEKTRDRFIVYVKAGIYNEYITIGKDKANILLYGDGPTKTIITENRSVNEGVNKTMNTCIFFLLTKVGKSFISTTLLFLKKNNSTTLLLFACRVEVNLTLKGRPSGGR